MKKGEQRKHNHVLSYGFNFLKKKDIDKEVCDAKPSTWLSLDQVIITSFKDATNHTFFKFILHLSNITSIRKAESKHYKIDTPYFPARWFPFPARQSPATMLQSFLFLVGFVEENEHGLYMMTVF
ncbi:hypothetical protein P8452_03498 [Trifolium repens]|nr:hypothetical protein QL285_003720 [Trifolium repens]WJX13062.1 hypothetical protein P8452_03498 [Trifolium repens]